MCHQPCVRDGDHAQSCVTLHFTHSGRRGGAGTGCGATAPPSPPDPPHPSDMETLSARGQRTPNVAQVHGHTPVLWRRKRQVTNHGTSDHQVVWHPPRTVFSAGNAHACRVVSRHTQESSPHTPHDLCGRHRVLAACACKGPTDSHRACQSPHVVPPCRRPTPATRNRGSGSRHGCGLCTTCTQRWACPSH